MNHNTDRDNERFVSLDDDEDTEPETDAMEASDQARPWVPPSDAPVTRGGREGVQVGVGFASTSEHDGGEDGESSPGRGSVARRSDDEITARVRRLLRTDAATSAMRLEIETVDGVVYLRGEVDTLDDGDLAAEVAARVRDVEDVVDETWLRD